MPKLYLSSCAGSLALQIVPERISWPYKGAGLDSHHLTGHHRINPAGAVPALGHGRGRR